MKKILLLVFFAVFSFNLTAQQKNLHHNPWELIIYRPENSPSMNEVRCYLRLLDEQGNDVTFSAAKATYEWVSIPNVVNQYQKTRWLSGGVAMHLNLKPGKYKISFYTPADKQYPYPSENRNQWESNVFEYVENLLPFSDESVLIRALYIFLFFKSFFKS